MTSGATPPAAKSPTNKSSVSGPCSTGAPWFLRKSSWPLAKRANIVRQRSSFARAASSSSSSASYIAAFAAEAGTRCSAGGDAE